MTEYYLVSIYNEVIYFLSKWLQYMLLVQLFFFFFFFFLTVQPCTQCFTMMTWQHYQNGTETRQPRHWYQQCSTRVCFCIIAISLRYWLHGSYMALSCWYDFIYFLVPNTESQSNLICSVYLLVCLLFLLPFYFVT